MNHSKHGSTMLLLSLLFAGLFNTMSAADIFVVNSESRTLSHINTVTQSVNNVFCQLGLTPNRFTLDENYIYVALSSDNAIQMISRQTGTHLRYIPIAPSSNPWDCLKAGDYLYVTGLFTNKVYKVSLQSYTVVDQIVVGTSPEGLLAHDGKLYITNAGSYQSGYAGSSVSVIDLASFSVLKTIPVWPNPQYLALINGSLHVSCTGNWVDQMGKICIIDTQEDTLTTMIDMGGNPGGLWFDGISKVFLGDMMNSGLFSYDPFTLQPLNPASDPLYPGGITVSGTQDFIAILDASWGMNGTLRLRNHDMSFLADYTVAMAPTDMQIHYPAVSAEDYIQPPMHLQVFPNPAKAGSHISFVSDQKHQAQITIYNLKGQSIDSFMSDGTVKWVPRSKDGGSLSPGIYFYRYQSLNESKTGKLFLR